MGTQPEGHRSQVRPDLRYLTQGGSVAPGFNLAAELVKTAKARARRLRRPELPHSRVSLSF